MKPCLTDKTLQVERITLLENEKIISDGRDLVKFFSEYFSNIVPKLVIQDPPSIILHHDQQISHIERLKTNNYFG